jgi:hypothetical protein
MLYRPYSTNAKFRTNKATVDNLDANIVGVDFNISTTSSVAVEVTIDDDGPKKFEGVPGLWEDGLELTYGDGVYAVQGVEMGGDSGESTVILHAIGQGVAELNNGSISPEYSQTKNVPGWVDSTIGTLRQKFHRVIDPNLSDKTVEAPDGGDDDTDKTTTWDMLNETAKRCGAWCWFTDTSFYFGKPSWLVDVGMQSEWRFVWDDRNSHTDGLTKKPKYSLDFSKKTWEGREELVIEIMDPDDMNPGPRLARNIRPGDRLTYKGKNAPKDPLWIVTEVQLPFVNVDPVVVTAWRPIDPPEIVDENGASGSGTAGVPQGPLGKNGWNGEQLENAAEIVKAGQAENKALDAIYIAVLAAMGESGLRNLGYGDNAINPDGTMNDSVGLFQQQARFEGGNWSRTDRTTPSKSAKIFYDAMDKHNWQKYYNEGGASEIFGGYYGPGKSANSASLAVHNIQRNSNPLHYAQMSGGTLWPDAKIVVDACIAAGKSSGSGDGKAPSGPLGARMKRSIESMTGRYIDVDGSFGAQCADVGMQYARDLWGIGMVIGNGTDYWRQSQIAPYCDALPVSASPRYGDIASWSGSYGAYTNGGAGHIAIYISGNPGSGACMFLTQNPGPARIMPLSTSGIQGWMRPKS